jgi:hypothetical protein
MAKPRFYGTYLKSFSNTKIHLLCNNSTQNVDWKREDNIKMDFEVLWEAVDCVHLALDRD